MNYVDHCMDYMVQFIFNIKNPNCLKIVFNRFFLLHKFHKNGFFAIFFTC